MIASALPDSRLRLPCLAALLAGAIAAPAPAGNLLRFDFNQPGAWPEASRPGITEGPVGTIDVFETRDRSGGLRLALDSSAAALSSGLLAWNNKETDLGKITMGFDYRVTAAAPVTVRLESFDAERRRTGGIDAVLHPAAAGFHQRTALELSDFKPAGNGKFDPAGSFVQISYALARPGELWLDNLALDTPGYYVSPAG